jgi:hypothetical protein
MPKHVASQKLGGAGRRRVVAGLVAAASAVVTPATRLYAGCPRSGGEQARRIVPSVLFWPAAPFVLTAQPKRVPLPAEGARVRVSARRPGGGVVFTTGRLVALDSSGARVASESGVVVAVPRSELLCLQVARRSAKSGALSGVTIGGVSGMAAGFLVASTAADAGTREEGYFLLPVVFGSLGAIGGAITGSIVHATSWDTALDLTR